MQSGGFSIDEVQRIRIMSGMNRGRIILDGFMFTALRQGHVSFVGGIRTLCLGVLVLAWFVSVGAHASLPPPGAFQPVSGNYFGLFEERDEIHHRSSGCLNLMVSDQGFFTARLQNNGTKYRFSGQFDDQGTWTKTLQRGKQEPLTVALQLDLSGDSGQLTGVVSNSQWTAELLGQRAVLDDPDPSPFAGKYTVDINGQYLGDDDLPYGDSVLTVHVLPSGKLLMRGWLADGTPVVQTAFVWPDGTWPLYVPLYGGRGSVLAWVNIPMYGTDDIRANLYWNRPAGLSQRFYPAGFEIGRAMVGCAYVPPANKRTPILDLTYGKMSFVSHETDSSFDNDFYLRPDNRVISLSTNRLILAFDSSNGLMRGNVADPATGKLIGFKGVVMQNQNFGYGFFPGQHQSGFVELWPWLP